MTKKKVILVAAAALFAVSGLTALPSGNITGGVGCIVLAAVCAYFGLKKKSAGKFLRFLIFCVFPYFTDA